MPGPKRTPKKILEERGSLLGIYRDDDLPAPVGDVKCPGWLDFYGKKCWVSLVKKLEDLKVFSSVDEDMIILYCVTWSRWMKYSRFLKKKGETYECKGDEGYVFAIKIRPEVKLYTEVTERLIKLGREFGLSPSARASLTIEKPKKKDKKSGGITPFGGNALRKTQ